MFFSAATRVSDSSFNLNHTFRRISNAPHVVPVNVTVYDRKGRDELLGLPASQGWLQKGIDRRLVSWAMASSKGIISQ